MDAMNDTRQPTPGVYGAEIIDCDDAPVSVTRYAWRPNSYTDLRDTLIGPGGDAQDGDGLFPRGWTPETEEKA